MRFGKQPAPPTLRPVSVSCRTCDHALPLRLANAGEESALWCCRQCHARYAGILEAEEETELLQRVCLAELHFDPSTSVPLPDLGQHLIERLHDTQKAHEWNTRRQSVRVPKHLPVIVARLSRQYIPICQPLRAIVYNLSEDGLGLITSERIESPYVAVQIVSGNITAQLFGKRVRSRLLKQSIWESGIEFTFRLNGRKSEKEPPTIDHRPPTIDHRPPTIDHRP